MFQKLLHYKYKCGYVKERSMENVGFLLANYGTLVAFWWSSGQGLYFFFFSLHIEVIVFSTDLETLAS